MFIKEIIFEKDYKKIINNENLIKKYNNDILNSKLLIIKNIFDKKKILDLKKYLIEIGRNSLPGYYPVKLGSPNHHRIINNDHRSIVKGKFHQFSFFRWNQDIHDVFKIFQKGYWIKNLLTGIKKNTYLNQAKTKKEREVVARVSIQFYPSGMGYMNEHSDPVGFHQVSAPLVIMSEKGKDKDFETGGSFIYFKNRKNKIYVEDLADIGDLVLYDSSLPHGVDLIDKGKKNDWINFRGRWTAVLASNKVQGSHVFKDAIDIQRGGI